MEGNSSPTTVLDELFRKYDMTQIYDADPVNGNTKKTTAVWDEDYVRFLVNADPAGEPGEVRNN